MSDTWKESPQELRKKRPERKQEHKRARREVQEYLRDEKWEEEDIDTTLLDDVELEPEDIEAAKKYGINLY